MNHAQIATRLVLAVVVACFVVVVLAFCSQQVEAQGGTLPPVRGCQSYSTEHVEAWFICATEQHERRLKALEDRPPAGLSKQDVRDMVWGERTFVDWWYHRARAERILK